MSELIVLCFLWGIPAASLIRIAISVDAGVEYETPSKAPIEYPDNYLPAPGEYVPIRSRPGPMWAP
jgi:hypothetical protein